MKNKKAIILSVIASLILLVLIVPFIWVTYYFLAKYLKHLERKSEENV